MKHICFFLTVLFYLPVTAQKHFAYIDQYQFNERKGEEKMVVLSMPIGKFNITNYSGDTAALKFAGPLMIDVVCTDYPSNASLTSLNQKRFDELFKTFPYLKNKPLQQVNCFRQLNGNTSEAASKMFHGLVIKFRVAQSEETIKDDLTRLDELLKMAIPDLDEENAGKEATPTEATDEYAAMETLRRKPKTSSNNEITVYQDGNYVLVDPRQSVAELQSKGKLKGDTVKVIRSREIYSYFRPGSPYASLLAKSNVDVPIIITGKKDWFAEVIGSTPERRKEKRINIDSIGKTGYKPSLPDSSLLKIFQRNKQWNNMVVVADVTGSMYPYSAQLLIWVKSMLEENDQGNFIFFNDGDKKRDNEKVIGSIGGIYSKTSNSFLEIRELIKQAMHNGGGGDTPENNIEALLQAERDYPKARFNVMIADNWAPVKDKMLMDKLTKPVKVILCGVYQDGINVDYLNLVRYTKGSLHIGSYDFLNIASINESEVLNLGNRSYKVINNSFVDITDERGTFKRF